MVLDPTASSELSFRDKRSLRKPDRSGMLIPDTVESGNATLRAAKDELSKFAVATNIATYDVNHATCQVTCSTCNGYSETEYDPDSFWVFFDGGDEQLSATSYTRSGTAYNTTATANWLSNNTKIASVGAGGSSHPGLVTGVSPGASPIYLINSITISECGDPPSCETDYIDDDVDGNIAPIVTINQDNTSVPISGNGYTFNQTLTASGSPSGGTYQWTSSSGLSLQTSNSSTVSFTGTSNGNQSLQIEYTYNGVSTTAAATVDVQQPNGLATTNSFPSTYSCSGVYNTSQLNILYTVTSGGQPIQFPNIPVVESFVPISNNCSGVNNTPNPTQGLTQSNGSFNMYDELRLCSSSCLPVSGSGQPQGSCTLQVQQTWSAAGYAVQTKNISYTCPGPPTLH